MNNNQGVRVLKWLEIVLLLILGGLVAWLAIEGWFDPLRFKALAGDDLANLEPSSRSYGESIQFLASYFKFRPVMTFALWAVTHWTRGEALEMASIGIAIHALNALIFFFLVYRVIRVPLAISFGLTVIAVLNRFAANIISPNSATAEGIGITALLLIIAVAFRFNERPSVSRGVVLTLLFLVIVHIHERFLGLAAPLMLIAIGAWTSSRASAAVLALGTASTCLLNFALKKLWLGTPFLIGTETRPIDFNISQICTFVWHGALNLAGINSGPSYLSLENFSESASWVRYVSVAAALLSCGLVIKIVRDAIRSPAGQERRTAFFRVAFFVSATGGLLLSASITFRQEYRWLYPAYIVFLCFLCLGIRSAVRPGAWSQLLVIGLIFLSLSREAYLRQRLPNLFYFHAQQVASNLFSALQNVDGVRSKETVLIRGDVPSYDWAFLGDTFSRVYHLPHLEFAGGPPVAEEIGPGVVVMDYHNSDSTFTLAQAKSITPAQGYTMSYSALEKSAATLVPDPQISTPTQTPLFITSQNGVMCMVAVAPLDVTVEAPAGAGILRVCLSHIYALGDGVNVEVMADSATGSATLLAREVPPLPNNEFPVWRKYELTLPSGTQNVHLHVFSKSGDPTADWVGFRDFSFEQK